MLFRSSHWDNLNELFSHCGDSLDEYKQNFEEDRLNRANKMLDDALTKVMPFVKNVNEIDDASKKAFQSYSKTINEQITETQELLRNAKKEIDETTQSVKKSKTEIESFEEKLFKSKDALDPKISTFYSDISDFHKKLMQGNGQIAAIKLQIEEAQDTIKKAISASKSKIEDLDEFYAKIFGTPSEEDENVLIGGLKQELEKRQEELNKFKTQQESKYKTLVAEIESLLPGATSAGLASSYGALRRSFSKPIKLYTNIFYCTLVGLFLCSTPFVIESISIWPPSIKFLAFQNWNQIPIDIIHKLPLVIPIVWVTLFVSSRRSEALRLQQEYAHKEAISKSFESFKKQINELRDDDTEKEALMTKLLETAIDAISFNASNTLDGKHKDKTPFDSILEPISKFVSGIPKNGLSIDIGKSKNE